MSVKMKNNISSILAICITSLCLGIPGQVHAATSVAECGDDYRTCLNNRLESIDARVEQIESDYKDAKKDCKDRYDEQVEDGNIIDRIAAEIQKMKCLTRAHDAYLAELEAYADHLRKTKDVCWNNYLSCIEFWGPF